MTTSLLVFGFLLGVQHALEADHVAAVASLATRAASLQERVTLAGLWGVGHAATLLAAGALVIVLGLSLPPALADTLDAVVGLMLVGLGLDVLRRLRRTHVHFHVHRHSGGERHVHAHAHADDAAHDPEHHEHAHPRGIGRRALLVGTVHGLAGSAALVLVAAAEARSIRQALAYLAVFAVGSIVGMMSLSTVIAMPLRRSTGHLARVHRALEATLGGATAALGCWIAVHAFTGR